MKRSSTVLLGLLLAALGSGAGCGREPASADVVERALLEADREFARDATSRGLDGWMNGFASDAARLEMEGTVIRGIEAIRESDAGMFEDPSLRLEWSPTDAGAFRTGDHGFTRGRYEVVRNPDGTDREVISRGTYLTVWRQEADGWKVILDTGVPDVE